MYEVAPNKNYPSKTLLRLHITEVFRYTKYCFVRNHVKLGVLSKGTLLHGRCWLWVDAGYGQISGGLQTCIAKRSKVPNG
jgi:hypothetical protein